MESAWFVLALLACPLGMVAMGGVVWLAAKVGRGRTSTVPSRPSMMGCNPLATASGRSCHERESERPNEQAPPPARELVASDERGS